MKVLILLVILGIAGAIALPLEEKSKIEQPDDWEVWPVDINLESGDGLVRDKRRK